MTPARAGGPGSSTTEGSSSFERSCNTTRLERGSRAGKLPVRLRTVKGSVCKAAARESYGRTAYTDRHHVPLLCRFLCRLLHARLRAASQVVVEQRRAAQLTERRAGRARAVFPYRRRIRGQKTNMAPPKSRTRREMSAAAGNDSTSHHTPCSVHGLRFIYRSETCPKPYEYRVYLP